MLAMEMTGDFLKTQLKKLKLTNDIILTGKVMDKSLIGSILCNSKIMLFPSIYDTDGIVKYEAADLELQLYF